jgi:hypothetical protein
VKDSAQAKQEGLIQLEYKFPTDQFHKHDPKGIVLQFTSQVSSCWPYVHEKFEDEYLQNVLRTGRRYYIEKLTQT